MAKSQSKSTRERATECHRVLCHKSLRPIQIWAPGVRSPSFQLEAHRQSQAVATSRCAREDQAYIDAVSAMAFDDDDLPPTVSF
jgi:hypothetical protein